MRSKINSFSRGCRLDIVHTAKGICRTKSTYLQNIKYSYDHVRRMIYHCSLFTNTEFSNIDNILSLGLSLSNDYPFQLQVSLDKAHRLFELEFQVWSTKEMPPFNINSTSVRRLDLEGRDELYNPHCFDRQQCITLSKSPLGIQCQVLHIEVKDPLGIVELVYKMVHLRTLHVYYENDSRNHRLDLLKWLQRRS